MSRTPRHTMNKSIRVRRFKKERTRYGDPVAGKTEKMRARVVTHVEEIRLPGGKERTSSHRVSPERALRMYDSVWLDGQDDADEAQALQVMKVLTVDSFDGKLEVFDVLIG